LTDILNDKKSKIKIGRAEFIAKYSPVILIVIFIAIFTLINPKFLVRQNIINILIQMVPIGLLGIGTMFVLISGGIDLTAGVGVSLAAVVIALVFKMSESTFLSIIIMFISLFIVSFINGLLIAKIRLNAVIATLIMMTVVEGAVLLITTVTGSFVNIESPFYLYLSRGKLAGLPISFIFLCLCFYFGSLILNKTKSGAHIFAIGNNIEGARHVGINVSLTTFIPYLISGISMGLAALVIASRVLWISPGLGGTPILLDAIAANVIGGVSVSGGKGSIRGLIFGTILVAVINNAVNIINIGPAWYDGFKGLVIIVMILLNKILDNVDD